MPVPGSILDAARQRIAQANRRLPFYMNKVESVANNPLTVETIGNTSSVGRNVHH